MPRRLNVQAVLCDHYDIGPATEDACTEPDSERWEAGQLPDDRLMVYPCGRAAIVRLARAD